MTQRTALCVTAAGHLYYAWGEEIDGPTLGKGQIDPQTKAVSKMGTLSDEQIADIVAYLRSLK